MIKTVFVQTIWFEILNDNVCACSQLANDILAFFGCDIYSDRFLIAITTLLAAIVSQEMEYVEVTYSLTY